jgi:hypothetical protein
MFSCHIAITRRPLLELHFKVEMPLLFDTFHQICKRPVGTCDIHSTSLRICERMSCKKLRTCHRRRQHLQNYIMYETCRFRSQDNNDNVSFDFSDDMDVYLEVQSDVNVPAASQAIHLCLAYFGGAQGTYSPCAQDSQTKD